MKCAKTSLGIARFWIVEFVDDGIASTRAASTVRPSRCSFMVWTRRM
jgi:hypothetical protein